MDILQYPDVWNNFNHQQYSLRTPPSKDNLENHKNTNENCSFKNPLYSNDIKIQHAACLDSLMERYLSDSQKYSAKPTPHKNKSKEEFGDVEYLQHTSSHQNNVIKRSGDVTPGKCAEQLYNFIQLVFVRFYHPLWPNSYCP